MMMRGHNKQQQQQTTTLSDLSWEERTRQAWERLRNGVTGTTPEPTGTSDPTNTKQPPSPERPLSATAAGAHSYPAVAVDPREARRRVTFGSPRQHVYYHDDDDQVLAANRSSSQRKKTKLQLRGTRFIGGAINKMKRSMVRTDHAVGPYSAHDGHPPSHSSSPGRRSRSRSPGRARRLRSRSPNPYGADCPRRQSRSPNALESPARSIASRDR